MKQSLNEQFRRMQKLAGIITESYADYYNEQEKYFEELEAAVNSGRATPEESKMYDEWVKAREEGGGASAPGGVHEAEGGTQYDILQNGEGGEDLFQDKEEIVQYFERRGILNFELEDGEQISVEDGVDRMMNGETLVVTNEELVEMGDDYAEWSVEPVGNLNEQAGRTVGYDGDDWEVVSEYPNMLKAIEGVIKYLRSNPEMFMDWMIGDGLPALKQYGLTTPVIHLAGPGETPGSQPPMVVAMDELD